MGVGEVDKIDAPLIVRGGQGAIGIGGGAGKGNSITGAKGGIVYGRGNGDGRWSANGDG